MNTQYLDQSSKILPLNINLSSKQTIIGLHDASGSVMKPHWHTSSQKTMNRDHSSIPQKYNNLLHRTTQIPRSSILKLINQMDSNNDGYITADDIVRFSNKQFLFFDVELTVRMFEEAASKRVVSFKEQYNHPINIEEILGAVQIHYKKKNLSWEENPRPYRDQWIKLLKSIGENLPNRRDLSPLKVEKILDMHELNLNTFKPQLNQSKGLLHTLPKPQKVYSAPYRPEAGLIVNNTENVREAIMDAPSYEQLAKLDAFEKVVNGKIKMSDNNPAADTEFPTIKFETKAFYQEAERLSRHPEQYLKGRNPIYTFLPENNSYQVKQKNFDQESFIQPKKLTQVKFDKSFGSFNSPDFHESGFFQEMDELQKDDLESITMDQQPWLNKKKTQQSQPSFRKMSSIQQFPTQQMNTQLRSIPEQSLKELPPGSVYHNYQQEEIQKPIFVTTFKLEDCRTVKVKMAINEPVTDQYIPPSAHQFREEYVHQANRVIFKTRTKVDPLHNPHGTSDHDQRPQFAIEKDLIIKAHQDTEEKRIMNEQLGIFLQPKDWVNFFPLADRHHNFVDMKRPEFIETGSYKEPSTFLTSLLRGDTDFQEQFKLFHRQLRKDDKNLFLGEVKDSKF